MTRPFGRAIATAILGAVAGATWLVLFYGTAPALQVDFDTSPPGLVTGIYPAERDRASGLTFAWTGGEASMRLPGIPRQVEWVLVMRVRGARVEGNPTVEFFADGLVVSSYATAPDFENVRITIPARPQRSGLTVTLRVSDTFVPGPHDPRSLGVMVDWLRLEPSGAVLAPRRAFAGTLLASAAMGAAIALLGVTPGSAVGAVILLSAGIAAAIARGFGPYTEFPDLAVRLAVWIGLLSTALTLAVEAGRREPLRNTAKFAAAFSASALLLELLVLLHPDMPIGDALFHAHRFRDVVAGNFHFTSIAPGGYRFPYAPGLYVVALPFADFVRPGTGDTMLLRIIVCAGHAAAGILLYSAVVRNGGDRLAAAITVGLHHLMPLSFRVVTVGNLTNAFAQSLSVAVLFLMATASVGFDRPLALALFAAVVAAAFLSHTGTFAILVVAMLIVAVLFRWRGNEPLRRSGTAVVATLGAAAAVALALYYVHFMETYRTEFARIFSETAGAAPDAGGRGVGDRLRSVPRYLWIYFGPAAGILAGWGALLMWRRHARDALTLTVAGWALACLGFLVLGILTPVDMRHYLAVLPALAIAGGLGAASGWQAGGARRAAVAGLLGAAVVTGVATWWSTF